MSRENNWTEQSFVQSPEYIDNDTLWRRRNLSGFVPIQDRFGHYIGVERTVDSYVIPAICLIGIVGNIINLIVLTRARFSKQDGASESGAQIGLVALSVADLLFCAIMFPRGFIRSTHSLFPTRSFLLFYQAYGTGLVTTLILVSTWITVIMAMLRYLGICHPLRSRNILGPCLTKVFYLIVTVVSVCFNLPSFWQYAITDMQMSENATYYLIDIGYMDNNKPRGIIFAWSKAFYGLFTPAVILVFCNCSLILALRRSQKMRKQCFVKETGSSSHNRVTLTLVTIVTAFVLLVFPSELMDFFLQCIKMDANKTEVFLLVRSLANTLQVLNFSCNFFLYCSVNSLFRSTVRQLICCQTRSTSNNSLKYGQLRGNHSSRTHVTVV